MNSGAPIADVRSAKNLVQHRRTRDAAQQASRVFPRGANVDGVYASMLGAVWAVTAKTGNFLTLADPAGGDGPIAYDGQLVELRVVSKLTGSVTRVVHSTVATQVIEVDAGGPFTVGDVLTFRRLEGAALLHVTSLSNDAAVRAYGVRSRVLDLADVPGTVNVTPNAACRTWAGGAGTLPTGWGVLGAPTVAKETSSPFTQIGGQSIKVTATAAGQGVASPMGPLALSAAQPYVSGYARLYVASGQVKVRLQLSDGTTLTALPRAPQVASSSQTGAWLDLGVSGIDGKVLNAVQGQILVESMGAAVFYVDAAQVTESAAQEPLIDGAGPTRLWQAANRELLRASLPPERYEIAAVDLRRTGATADNDFVVGGTVRIVDARLVPSAELLDNARLRGPEATPGSGRVAGWSALGANATGGFAVDATRRAQQVTVASTTAANGYLGVSQTTAPGSVRHGDTVGFSVDFEVDRSGGMYPQACVFFLDAGGSQVGGGCFNLEPSSLTRGQLTFSAIAPASTSRVQVQVYLTRPATGGSGVGYFRNATLRITSTLPVSTRLVQLERNYLVPGTTALTLTTDPDDLLSDLARVPAAARRPAAVPDVVDPGPTRIDDVAITQSGANVTLGFRLYNAAGLELTDTTGVTVTVTKVPKTGSTTTSTPAVSYTAGRMQVTVTREIFAAYSAAIACSAIAGRSAASTSVALPTQGVSGAPAFPTFTGAPNTGTDRINLAWTTQDFPSGTTIELLIDDESRPAVPTTESSHDVTGTTAYDYDPAFNIVASGTAAATRFTLVARYAGEEIASRTILVNWFK